MRRILLAVFVTGTPSKRTMDLPENGAITTSVGSRDSASLLFLHRVGVTFTCNGNTRDVNPKLLLCKCTMELERKGEHTYLECTHSLLLVKSTPLSVWCVVVVVAGLSTDKNGDKTKSQEFLITDHTKCTTLSPMFSSQFTLFNSNYNHTLIPNSIRSLNCAQ